MISISPNSGPNKSFPKEAKTSDANGTLTSSKEPPPSLLSPWQKLQLNWGSPDWKESRLPAQFLHASAASHHLCLGIHVTRHICRICGSRLCWAVSLCQTDWASTIAFRRDLNDRENKWIFLEALKVQWKIKWALQHDTLDVAQVCQLIHILIYNIILYTFIKRLFGNLAIPCPFYSNFTITFGSFKPSQPFPLDPPSEHLWDHPTERSDSCFFGRPRCIMSTNQPMCSKRSG